MKIRPLGDKVLLKRAEAETKTAGGLIIPDSSKEKPAEGVVIAAGNGIRDNEGKLHALEVKAGDKVLFGKWAGTEVKVDGETYLMVKESDILGIIE